MASAHSNDWHLAVGLVVALILAGCAAGPPWLDRQASGDSIFYFHVNAGSAISEINRDAIAYCASRGKSAVLGSRVPDGFYNFHSNYVCR